MSSNQPRQLIKIALLCKCADDKPKYHFEDFKDIKPVDCPMEDSPEFKELSAFGSEVGVILQTVLDDEYLAALSLMEPPSKSFESPVIFKENKVMGMFAGHKAALIKIEAGVGATHYIQTALDVFPSTQLIVSVGVCYAFNKRKYKLGDVLVSKEICSLKLRRNPTAGPSIVIPQDLIAAFCMTLNFKSDFQVSDSGRISAVHSGKFLSHPLIFVEDSEMRDKYRDAVPGVIGGDKEGSILMPFQQNNKVNGIILIKGVVDYGEEHLEEAEEWFFTASLAAVKYAHSQLCKYKFPGEILVTCIESEFGIT